MKKIFERICDIIEDGGYYGSWTFRHKNELPRLRGLAVSEIDIEDREAEHPYIDITLHIERDELTREEWAEILKAMEN